MLIEAFWVAYHPHFELEHDDPCGRLERDFIERISMAAARALA